MLPSHVDAVVKQMLWDGKRAIDIARLLDMNVNTVYNIKAGRRGYNVAWPNGVIGMMPLDRAAATSAQHNNRGVNKDLQEQYNMVKDIAEHHPQGGGSGGNVIIDNTTEQIDPRITEQEERMSEALSRYRVEWAFANGYHEDLKPILNTRSDHMDTPLNLAELTCLADLLCDKVADLLGDNI